jgi:non-ribosomal peptide synthetase component F
VSALLGKVKEMMLSAYAHQDVPFEQVVEALQPPRSLSHNPVVQVMFVMQNAPRSDLQLPGLTLATQTGLSNLTAKFDLTLSLEEMGEDIVGGLNYASDLFDRATIERWIGYLKAALRAMVQEAQHEVP